MDPIVISSPPSEERDAALGRYMDAWSRLETSINYTTQEILGIDADAGFVIWAAIQTRQSIDVLDAAAKLKFDKSGQTRVAQICEQLVRRNMRRNHIVHGFWRFKVQIGVMGGEPEVGEWRRVYDHVDPDREPSADGSSFTVAELDKTTGHVEEMIEALWSLEQDIPSLLIRPRTFLE